MDKDLNLFCFAEVRNGYLYIYIAHVVLSDSIVKVPNKMKCCVEPEVLLISPIRKEAQNATKNKEHRHLVKHEDAVYSKARRKRF